MSRDHSQSVHDHFTITVNILLGQNISFMYVQVKWKLDFWKPKLVFEISNQNANLFGVKIWKKNLEKMAYFLKNL